MHKKRLKMIGPAKMYKYLFVIGLINILQPFKLYLNSLGINLATLSDLSCRLFVFYTFSISPIAPMILVYISIERYISNLLMVIFTLLLISTIFSSRRRVITNYTFRQNETFRRDVKFAFSSLILNIIFILLNLPSTIMYFVGGGGSKYPNLFLFLVNINNLGYSIDFFLIFIANSLFRQQFLFIFCKCLLLKQKSKHKYYFNCFGSAYKFLFETYF